MSGKSVGLATRLLGRLFLCPRGRHRRSLGHVRAEGETYVSRCRSCGRPMRRLSKRNWVLDDRRA